MSLAGLPNLGPKSRDMLERAGIVSVPQLRRLGAVAAYAQVQRSGQPASLNLLWALEGALTGTPWQQVAREHRTSLLLALDGHQSRDRA
ncbi:TfoX/Sxy family protein [Ramlibacter pallidus]|uniref:TfoX/Sxy family protein n=1 Tax=Ramlibacter pallidus TaxID=2780087 RepID=A0ABR9RZE4_9BURK|nr:TfoX/Sxy family protein [Ramlibacter pallidus]MBE7366603.1 TfoX/Sxy family protein [Ramlibacter pallidus]